MTGRAGATTRYPVNSIGELAMGCAMAALLIAFASVPAWAPDAAFGGREAAILLALLAGSAMPLASHFLVTEVQITAGRICFLPIGVTIPLRELEAVTEVDYPALGSIQRVTFRPKSRRLRWVQLTMLWAGYVVSMRLTGLDGRAFLANPSEMHEALTGIAEHDERRAGDGVE